MQLRNALVWLGFGSILFGCSSQDADADPVASLAASVQQPRAAWVPANLPADVCNATGGTDLNVAAGQNSTITPEDPCDALVAQPDGLPSICVRKFANVNVAGTLSSWSSTTRVLALVATGDLTIASGGAVRVGTNDGGDPRGVGGGPGGPGGGSGGAGRIGAGAAGGSQGGQGGSAFGPTEGTQLVSGAMGGGGGTIWDGYGGGAGGAIQLVACHQLALAGTVDVRGQNGSAGRDGYEPHMSIPGGGGGGGSGGSVVLDAPSITAACGAQLVATGGAGGRGGHAPEQNQVGGAGGGGGTGAQTPEPGGQPTGGTLAGGGGGGGAVGRIVLHLPNGASTPTLDAAPPVAVVH